MRFLLTYIQRFVMLALTVCTLLACSDEESLMLPSDVSEGGNVLLRIAIGRAGGTRVSRPQGGENGDGREPGQHHENDINSLSLYVSQTPINGNASAPVRLVAHLTELNLTPADAREDNGSFIYEIRVDNKFINGYIFSPADKFIVVTNQSSPIGAVTLGELRNAYVSQPVRKVAVGEAMNGCTDFVMSNEQESSYVDGDGSPSAPHLIKVTIERITARVDFATTGSAIDNDKQALRYAATDGSLNQQVADVYVSHTRVFNAMTAPSFLIKRLAATASATSFYLADEIKPATSIVVEPNTWQKGTADDSQLSAWYGTSHMSQAKTLGDSWFRNADRVHIAAPTAGNDGFGTSVSTDESGNPYYLLDYVNENTMDQASTNGNVTTGILLRAIYKPLTVYGSLDGDKEPVEDGTYAYGQTFWRFRPMLTAYDETKALYFSNAATALAYKNAHPEVAAEITEYTDGKCYYPVFLRHDNTVETPFINMMEFGIVRNNIYRLKVGFTGPGYPTLDIPDDVNPEGIRPYIFVRKWYKIEHPEIEL